MTFEVEVAGRTRLIAIEPAGGPGRFRVTLDGQPRVVNVVRSGEHGLSLLGTAAPGNWTVPGQGCGMDGVTIALSVTPGETPGELLVYIGGRTVAARINGRQRSRSAEDRVHTAGEVAIVAPMPGRVVRVLVSPGDEVAARQGIVVVEAMKMENELRAPRAGRVKDVAVAPGASVEGGRILALIE